MSRRLPWAEAVLVGAALTSTGCMSGRASLLATNAARPAAALQGPGDLPASPGRTIIGPSRNATGSLASSGGGAVLGLAAPAQASVGALKLTGGLSASVAPTAVSTRSTASLAAAGTRTSVRTGVSITPTLAPAASVGASVAAVSQPLTVAASAKARAALKPAKGVAVQVRTGAGLGASVHVGGG